MVLWWGVRGLALLQADILFGLGVVLGKEEVMSKVDLEDEQEVDTERSGKERGLGGGAEESARPGTVTVLWEAGAVSGVGSPGPSPEECGLSLGVVRSLRRGLSREVASSRLYMGNGLYVMG